MGLTKTYFFRLDAHQTTLVRCMIHFATYFTRFLVICILFSMGSNIMDNRYVSDVVAHQVTAKMTHAQEEKLKTLKIYAGAYAGYVLLNVVIPASVIYAILSSERRTRWFMVPLFVLETIDFVFYAILFVLIEILLLVSSNFLPAFLVTVLAFVSLGIDIIGFRAAIESFSNIGSAKEHGSGRLEMRSHHSEVPYGRISTVLS